MKGSRLKGRLPFIALSFLPTVPGKSMPIDSMKWILCSIDGTGSKLWRKTEKDNSHAYRFVQEFGRGSNRVDFYSWYFDGPEWEITGSDAGIIRVNVLAHIKSAIRILFYNDSGLAKDHRFLRIVLIGHSRGGGIAVDLARQLKDLGIEVYFLGLFDAVDMSGEIDGGDVTNVKHSYHTLRGLRDSRWYFGNTGLNGTTRQRFLTSHGGVGGDPVTDPIEAAKGDPSCSLEPKVINAYIPASYWGTPLYRLETTQETLNRATTCLSESANAYAWMLGNARKHGVPI